MTKTELRKKIKKILESREKDFESESERISNDILTSPFFKNAQIILTYMALKDEANIFKVILRAQADGKKVFIPKTERNSLKMDFFELKKDSALFAGNLGVLEPIFEKNKFDFADNSGGEEGADKNKDEAQKFLNNAKNISARKILILVPGRAFTKDGERLGRGKGYYDNFLKNVSAACDCVVAGVCFPFQVFKKIPTEQHDFKMDFVFY